MTKPTSPFAGVRLSEQTSLAPSRLDQQLFAAPKSPPALPERTQQTSSSPKPRKQVSQESRNLPRFPASQIPSQEAGKPASLPPAPVPPFDLQRTPLWKTTFVFTEEELEALEDLKLELRRRFALKATKNDLIRCALHALIEDHRRQGERSSTLKRLRSKGSF
jgi:hypothetical protein